MPGTNFDAVIAAILCEDDGTALLRLDDVQGRVAFQCKWHMRVLNVPRYFAAAVGTRLCFRGNRVYVKGHFWAWRLDDVNLRLATAKGD